MNTHVKLELPPLPPGHTSYEFPDGGYDADEMRIYALAAIEPYAKRIAELEAARKCGPKRDPSADIELPPPPEGMILEGIWAIPVDEVIVYRDACINATIKANADAKAREALEQAGPKLRGGGQYLQSPRPEMTDFGMSLRDYFAAKALQGICASNPSEEWTDERIADEAYRLADAMLKARTNEH